MTLLALEDVVSGYERVPAIHGVSLCLGEGEAMSLLGRNGMGKTSLLRAIIGLNRVSSGSIVFRGTRIEGRRTHAIARLGVGLVPAGRGIFPNLTVREHLRLAELQSRACGRAMFDVDWALDRFPWLREREHVLGRTLSGGQQQLLAIMRAVLTNPSLLLVDDATEGLAPLVRRSIYGVLEELRREGVAMLIVDKSLDDLLRVCTRHCNLVKGRVAWMGTSGELVQDDGSARRRLGL